MPCEYCGSEATATWSNEDGELFERCCACGQLLAYSSADPGEPEDECELEGHDWQEIDRGDGYSISECQRCGLIED